MASTNKLGFSAALTLLGTSVVDAYTSFASATQQPSATVILQNLTDADAMISFDAGVTDHLPMASSSVMILDLNKYVTDQQLRLSKGTMLAAKRLVAGTGATTGSIWITVLYAIRN